MQVNEWNVAFLGDLITPPADFIHFWPSVRVGNLQENLNLENVANEAVGCSGTIGQLSLFPTRYHTQRKSQVRLQSFENLPRIVGSESAILAI